MTENDQRLMVVNEAKTWLNTRWHHAADIKGHGVDCAMLLLRVFIDTGMIKPFDPRPYPRDWMWHSSEERFLGCILSTGAKEIEEKSAKMGDIVVWKIGLCLAHGGIIVDFPYIIHSYIRARKVIISDISQMSVMNDKKYPRRFFSHWSKN